jgi:hypothetical protein
MLEQIFMRIEGDPANGDRLLFVDGWPREIEVTRQFLACCDPRYLTVEGDAMTFRADNGQAVYRMGELDLLRDLYPATLESSRWSEV